MIPTVPAKGRRRPVFVSVLLLGLVGLMSLAHLGGVWSITRAMLPPTYARVGLSGERFTLNDTPTFLLGISYFDARFWHTADLDALQQRGYNLIRIWLDWRDRGFFNERGELTDDSRTTLLGLVEAAGQRGLVVDVAILDSNLSFGREHAATAVQQVGSALAGYSNVFYDLANEFDHPEGAFSLAELGAFAVALRAVDPDAVVGVSSTTDYLVGHPAEVRVDNVQALLADPLAVALMIPHLPRTPDWWAQTAPRVQALRGALAGLGQQRPVYLQEEARRGHRGLNPSREEFIGAAQAALNAGAAAWVFHTDAGFTLNEQPLISSLDEVERSVLDELPAAVGLTLPPPATETPTPEPPPATETPTPEPPPATETPEPPGVPPFAVGARIEAEEARSAQERTRNGNSGSAPSYPNTTGLDVDRCYACSNQHSASLHWDETAGYPVAVPTDGLYTVQVRAVTTATNRSLTLLVDGALVVVELPVPPSESFNQLRELRSEPFSMSTGVREVTVLAPRGMSVDWLQVDPYP